MSDARTAPGVLPATVSVTVSGAVPRTVFTTASRSVPAMVFTTASPAVPATHGGFTFSDAMFYSPFATVPTGGPLDV
ncbi:hypothetical protein GCM10010433_39320 [Streptomyces pulveraceus]